MKKPMEWISVDDRLPENNTWCIASAFKDGKQIVLTEFYISVHGEFWHYMGSSIVKNTYFHITHWMLPEPPAITQ